MALRGRRINNFLKLRCLVASGDLSILVSSFNFQKSNIGWLQQPLAEILTVHFVGCNQAKIFYLGYNQGISYGYQDIITKPWLLLKKEGAFFHGYEIVTIRNVLITMRNALVVTKIKYFCLVTTNEMDC